MKTKLKSTLILALVLLGTFAAKAQAKLIIENNSMRSMTVKVMNDNGGKGTLHRTVTIEAYSNESVNFSVSGQYFTKTKAILKGKEPVYRKGEPFKIVNDATGYTEMTITFTITESTVPQASGGKAISKTEFDQN